MPQTAIVTESIVKQPKPKKRTRASRLEELRYYRRAEIRRVKRAIASGDDDELVLAVGSIIEQLFEEGKDAGVQEVLDVCGFVKGGE